MKLKDIMTSRVESVGPDTSVAEAAQKMRDLDVGPLPVCDNDRLAGIVTDRDIVVRAVAEGKDPRSFRVRDVMTPEVKYLFEDQDEEEAARLMQDEQIRRVLVLNRDKKLVGIVSLGDLAVRSGGGQREGKTLEEISEPALPRR